MRHLVLHPAAQSAAEVREAEPALGALVERAEGYDDVRHAGYDRRRRAGDGAAGGAAAVGNLGEEAQVRKPQRAGEVDLEDVVVGAHLDDAVDALGLEPGVIERLEDGFERHVQRAAARILRELRLPDAGNRGLIADCHRSSRIFRESRARTNGIRM